MKYIKKVIGIISVLATLLVSPAAVMAQATLSFDPSVGVINKGCEISIKINLDTQGVQTDGTDVIVLYTPAQLSINTSQIVNGTIYPEYPGNSVDQTGKVSISGISSVSSPYSGSGTFATLKFTVASTLTENTKVNLNFDYDTNNRTKTTDTNVVQRGTIADVLSNVTNGSYTVGTGNCPSGSGVTASPSPGGAGASSLNGGSGLNGQGQSLNGSSASQSAQYQVYKPNLNDLTGNGAGAGILDNTIVLTVLGTVLIVAGVVGLVLL